MKDAIRTAVQLAPGAGRSRMLRMRRAVQRHDVHAWAASFLEALAGHDAGAAPAAPLRLAGRRRDAP